MCIFLFNLFRHNSVVQASLLANTPLQSLVTTPMTWNPMFSLQTYSEVSHCFKKRSVRLHAQLNSIKAIARLCSSIGQLQLSAYKWRWVNRFIGQSVSCPGTIGGAVPISTSGNRATGWPLYVTSNNKLIRESDVSADSCQFTSGPYHFSDAPLFRPLGRMPTPPAALPAEQSAYDREEQWSVGQMIWTRSELTAVCWNIAFSSMSRFNLDFRESKPKLISPNSFSPWAR